MHNVILEVSGTFGVLLCYYSPRCLVAFALSYLDQLLLLLIVAPKRDGETRKADKTKKAEARADFTSALPMPR